MLVCLRGTSINRGVAQSGSAPEWGSGAGLRSEGFAELCSSEGRVGGYRNRTLS